MLPTFMCDQSALIKAHSICPLLSVAKYMVDVTIWNKAIQRGYLTVKLHSGDQEAVATISQ